MRRVLPIAMLAAALAGCGDQSAPETGEAPPPVVLKPGEEIELPDPGSSDDGEGSGLDVSQHLAIRQGGIASLRLKMPEADTGERFVTLKFSGLPSHVRVTNVMFVGRGDDAQVAIEPADIIDGVDVDISVERDAAPVDGKQVAVTATSGSMVVTRTFELTIVESPEASWPVGWTTTRTFEADPDLVLAEARAWLRDQGYEIRDEVVDEADSETRIYVITPDGIKVAVEVSRPFGKEAWLVVSGGDSASTKSASGRMADGISARIEARLGD